MADPGAADSLADPGAADPAAFLYPCFERIMRPRRGVVSPLLAVSGGPDSMALAFAFSRWWQAKGGGRLYAAVVDHRIRADSTQEARLVAERLRRLEIVPMILTARGVPPKAGVQAWARGERYYLLGEAALNLAPHSTSGACIITAHHGGDQAETVAMRLMHESGLRGLGGIGDRAWHHGVEVLRPLLDTAPQALRAMVGEANLAVLADPSNEDRRFERVRMRQMLTASIRHDDGQTGQDRGQNRGALAGDLQRLGESAKAIHGHLCTALGHRMRGFWGLSPTGFGWIDHAAFAALPPLARDLVVDGFMRAFGNAALPKRQAARAHLAGKLLDGASATLGGCEWRLHRGRLHGGRILCYREPVYAGPDVAVEAGRWAIFGGVWGGIWHVYAPVAGRFSPLGAAGVSQAKRLYAGVAALDEAPTRAPVRTPTRALWSLPVFTPENPHEWPGDGQYDAKYGGNRHNRELPTLEDGAILPHLVYNGADNPKDVPLIRFAGGAYLDWMTPHKGKALTDE